MNRERLEENVLKMIATVLDKDVSVLSSPKVRENLESVGMDSINALQLMLVLEEAYGIQFEEEEMLEENFAHIGKIVDLICKHLDRADGKSEVSL